MSLFNINIELIIFSTNFCSEVKEEIYKKVIDSSKSIATIIFGLSALNLAGKLNNIFELNSGETAGFHSPKAISSIYFINKRSFKLSSLYQSGLIDFTCTVEITDNAQIIFNYTLSINNTTDILSTGVYRIPLFTPEELVPEIYLFFFDNTPSTITLNKFGYLVAGLIIDPRINTSSQFIFTPKQRIVSSSINNIDN